MIGMTKRAKLETSDLWSESMNMTIQKNSMVGTFIMLAFFSISGSTPSVNIKNPR